MPVTLYQELIDLIIDEVADFDHKTSLFNCSLTSWSFHSSARKHIFRQIFISHRGQAPFREKSQTRLENLINILESDPSRSHPEFSPLSSDVRSLELFLIPPSESFTTIAMADKIRSCWDDFLSSLPILLQHLSGVQEFTLGTVSSINSWPALGNAVQSTLLQFFASPSLTSLEFLSVTQLPIMSIMSCCQNLHDLSLYSSTMAEAEIIPTSLSTGIGSLESLSLDTSSGLPFGLSYFYNVPYTPGKDPSMLWLSLKSLTIASIPPDLFSLDPTGYRGPVRLDLLPNLRRLELTFDDTPFHLEPFISLEKILLNLSWNTVDELVVCIELGNFWPTNAEFFLSDKSLSYDPLLCLDSAIRGPNLPSLAKFSLIIGVECAWSWSSGTRPQASEINNSLKTKIKNRLPSISNSSKIQLNVRIDTNVT